MKFDFWFPIFVPFLSEISILFTCRRFFTDCGQLAVDSTLLEGNPCLVADLVDDGDGCGTGRRLFGVVNGNKFVLSSLLVNFSVDSETVNNDCDLFMFQYLDP